VYVFLLLYVSIRHDEQVVELLVVLRYVPVYLVGVRVVFVYVLVVDLVEVF
jgi:hypothetical protein